MTRAWESSSDRKSWLQRHQLVYLVLRIPRAGENPECENFRLFGEPDRMAEQVMGPGRGAGHPGRGAVGGRGWVGVAPGLPCASHRGGTRVRGLGLLPGSGSCGRGPSSRWLDGATSALRGHSPSHGSSSRRTGSYRHLASPAGLVEHVRKSKCSACLSLGLRPGQPAEG